MNESVKIGIVLGITLLFIGVGIQPAFANVQPKEKIIDVEPKDYLFQTIIDIANNPDVKNLLAKYDNDLFKVDIDRSVHRKLLLRNPRLLFDALFTKPSMTLDYLDKCYNNGIEITNILGEDRASEIFESIKITDTKVFNKFNDIIINDEELSDKLAILKEMNKQLKPDNPYEDNPIICIILCVIGIIPVLYIEFYDSISQILGENSIFVLFLSPFYIISYLIAFVILITVMLYCWEFIPPC